MIRTAAAAVVQVLFQPHVSFLDAAYFYEQQFQISEVGFEAVEAGEGDGLVGDVGLVVEEKRRRVAFRVVWDGERGGDGEDFDVGIFGCEAGEELERRLG